MWSRQTSTHDLSLHVPCPDRSQFPNRRAMFKAAFWHDLDTVRWLAHVIAPLPTLVWLKNNVGLWYGAIAVYFIVGLSIFWPPGRYRIFDSFPRAKTFFSVIFGACLLLTNTLVTCGATGLAARELGAQGRMILVAGLAGGCLCIILSVVIRTPFRDLFHIPPEVAASIRDAMKDDEPSDPRKDRASRFDNGNSTAGPR